VLAVYSLTDWLIVSQCYRNSRVLVVEGDAREVLVGTNVRRFIQALSGGAEKQKKARKKVKLFYSDRPFNILKVVVRPFNV
jgi:hypothetical protein